MMIETAAAAVHCWQILGLWLWLSYRFEEGTFPGRERVQAVARQLSHWLNLGLLNIQSAAAREAAAAVRAVADAVSAAERPASSSSSSGYNSGCNSYDTRSDGVDSSDADEINEAVFRTPVVEVTAASSSSSSSDAAAAQEALADALSGSSSSSSNKAPQQQQQQQQRYEALQPVAYINWGSTVSIGLSGHSDFTGSAIFRSTAGSSSSSGAWGDDTAAAAGADRLLPAAESLETSYAAGTHHSVEVLEQLIMPEYDPSMAPFVRWKSRPRFVPPPPPAVAAAAAAAAASEDAAAAPLAVPMQASA
jgi:hypothetical protein